MRKLSVMNARKTIFFIGTAIVALSLLSLTSCKKEEVPENDYSDYDSLDLDFNDSITVYFGDDRWTTLVYDSYVEHEELSGFDWIYLEAHKPGFTYPKIKLKMFQGEGIHEADMTVNDAGLGYTVPGALYGDSKCGTIFYYEDGEVSSPDGTRTSDWWPMHVSMSVLKYVDSTSKVTAYITGTMFDYESWVNRDVLYVDSAEQRELKITFGELPVNR